MIKKSEKSNISWENKNYLPSLSQSYTSTLIVLLGEPENEDQRKKKKIFPKINVFLISSVYNTQLWYLIKKTPNFSIGMSFSVVYMYVDSRYNIANLVFGSLEEADPFLILFLLQHTVCLSLCFPLVMCSPHHQPHIFYLPPERRRWERQQK